MLKKVVESEFGQILYMVNLGAYINQNNYDFNSLKHMYLNKAMILERYPNKSYLENLFYYRKGQNNRSKQQYLLRSKGSLKYQNIQFIKNQLKEFTYDSYTVRKDNQYQLLERDKIIEKFQQDNKEQALFWQVQQNFLPNKIRYTFLSYSADVVGFIMQLLKINLSSKIQEEKAFYLSSNYKKQMFNQELKKLDQLKQQFNLIINYSGEGSKLQFYGQKQNVQQCISYLNEKLQASVHDRQISVKYHQIFEYISYKKRIQDLLKRQITKFAKDQDIIRYQFIEESLEANFCVDTNKMNQQVTKRREIIEKLLIQIEINKLPKISTQQIPIKDQAIKEQMLLNEGFNQLIAKTSQNQYIKCGVQGLTIRIQGYFKQIVYQQRRILEQYINERIVFQVFDHCSLKTQHKQVIKFYFDNKEKLIESNFLHFAYNNPQWNSVFKKLDQNLLDQNVQDSSFITITNLKKLELKKRQFLSFINKFRVSSFCLSEFNVQIMKIKINNSTIKQNIQRELGIFFEKSMDSREFKFISSKNASNIQGDVNKIIETFLHANAQYQNNVMQNFKLLYPISSRPKFYPQINAVTMKQENRYMLLCSKGKEQKSYHSFLFNCKSLKVYNLQKQIEITLVPYFESFIQQQVELKNGSFYLEFLKQANGKVKFNLYYESVKKRQQFLMKINTFISRKHDRKTNSYPQYKYWYLSKSQFASFNKFFVKNYDLVFKQYVFCQYRSVDILSQQDISKIKQQSEKIDKQKTVFNDEMKPFKNLLYTNYRDVVNEKSLYKSINDLIKWNTLTQDNELIIVKKSDISDQFYKILVQQFKVMFIDYKENGQDQYSLRLAQFCTDQNEKIDQQLIQSALQQQQIIKRRLIICLKQRVFVDFKQQPLNQIQEGKLQQQQKQGFIKLRQQIKWQQFFFKQNSSDIKGFKLFDRINKQDLFGLIQRNEIKDCFKINDIRFQKQQRIMGDKYFYLKYDNNVDLSKFLLRLENGVENASRKFIQFRQILDIQLGMKQKRVKFYQGFDKKFDDAVSKIDLLLEQLRYEKEEEEKKQREKEQQEKEQQEKEQQEKEMKEKEQQQKEQENEGQKQEQNEAEKEEQKVPQQAKKNDYQEGKNLVQIQNQEDKEQQKKEHISPNESEQSQPNNLTQTSLKNDKDKVEDEVELASKKAYVLLCKLKFGRTTQTNDQYSYLIDGKNNLYEAYFRESQNGRTQIEVMQQAQVSPQYLIQISL